MWIHPAGKQTHRHASDVLPEQNGRLRDSQRVEIHDAVEYAAALLLKLHPMSDGTQVVPQVSHARGLDPGENALHLSHADGDV